MRKIALIGIFCVSFLLSVGWHGKIGVQAVLPAESPEFLKGFEWRCNGGVLVYHRWPYNVVFNRKLLVVRYANVKTLQRVVVVASIEGGRICDVVFIEGGYGAMTVSNRLNELRAEIVRRGLKQSELCQVLGWYPEKLSRFLHLKRWPTPKDIRDLAGALGMSEDELKGYFFAKEDDDE